jgi:hypothetical protein
MRRTLVASSRKRRVASSLTMALSTWGWASRSKSETCQGAGRQAKLEAPPRGGAGPRWRPPRPRAGIPRKRCDRDAAPWPLQFPRRGLGRRRQAQIGVMGPQPLMDRVLVHARRSTIAA